MSENINPGVKIEDTYLNLKKVANYQSKQYKEVFE